MHSQPAIKPAPLEKLSICLLAIDSDPGFLAFLKEALGQEDFEILTTGDADAGMQQVARRHAQIVLLDQKIGGLEMLSRILEIDPGIDVIITAEDYSTESAVDAIQRGAADYLHKPVTAEQLQHRLARLVADAKSRRHSMHLERQLLDTIQFEDMISQSPLMWEVFVRIRRIAPHFRAVLVSGATGTGKELVARALHRLSPAAATTFAVRNCSALVETLLESELFGHVKGAFTGATQDKIGLFEFAQGGTVFLDEIGELPLSMQAKLLRVLQNGEIQRVGSPATRKVDVRVIAATHRDLRKMVSEGQFRQDLYYRLCMAEIKLPSLVERKEDVRLLARHFLHRFAKEYNKPISGITRRAHVLLARYSWPGNVRELENAIGHACMMAQGSVIDVYDLPEAIRHQDQPPSDDTLLTLNELSRRHARYVLERVDGNKLRAAEILNVSRSTLYRLLNESPARRNGRS